MNQYNAAGEAKTSVFVENVKIDCSQISVERATGKLKRSGCMDTTNSRSLAGELAKANWKSLKRSNTEVKAKVGYRISEAVTNPTLVCKHFPPLPLDDHPDGMLRRESADMCPMFTFWTKFRAWVRKVLCLLKWNTPKIKSSTY